MPSKQIECRFVCNIMSNSRVTSFICLDFASFSTITNHVANSSVIGIHVRTCLLEFVYAGQF